MSSNIIDIGVNLTSKKFKDLKKIISDAKRQPKNYKD